MFSKTFGVAAFAALAAATLDKPPLHPNLDYLNQGLLDNLHPTQSTYDQWGSGWLPQDCVDMTNNAGLDPRDVQAWNIHYTDVRNLLTF